MSPRQYVSLPFNRRFHDFVTISRCFKPTITAGQIAFGPQSESRYLSMRDLETLDGASESYPPMTAVTDIGIASRPKSRGRKSRPHGPKRADRQHLSVEAPL